MDSRVTALGQEQKKGPQFDALRSVVQSSLAQPFGRLCSEWGIKMSDLTKKVVGTNFFNALSKGEQGFQKALDDSMLAIKPPTIGLPALSGDKRDLIKKHFLKVTRINDDAQKGKITIEDAKKQLADADREFAEALKKLGTQQATTRQPADLTGAYGLQRTIASREGLEHQKKERERAREQSGAG